MENKNTFMDRLIKIGGIQAFAGNLFEVRFLGRDTYTGGTDDVPEAYEYKTNKETAAPLRCSSFSMGSPKAKYTERHRGTKEFFLEGMDHVDTITINWHEDRNLSVWNYHRQWMGRFYDRQTDCYIVGPQGKKRRAEIVVQEMHTRDWKGPTDDSTFKPPEWHPGAEDAAVDNVTHTFELIGLMPDSNYDMSLDWNSMSPEAKSITYHVDRIVYKATIASEKSTLGFKEANYMDGKARDMLSIQGVDY